MPRNLLDSPDHHDDAVLTCERPNGLMAQLEAAASAHGGKSSAAILDLRDAVDAGAAADAIAGAIALCRRPTALQRLQLIARGALEVLDVTWPREQLVARVRALASPRGDGPTLDDCHSRAPGMHALLEEARRTAETDTSLLVTGDTGVGKEFLARAVHGSGARRHRPFVVMNCGALPENLLESTLFGHERGAFTGADRTHKGYFEIADRGTLLLDEIGEMPPHLQVKLLTVLECSEVMRLGGAKPVSVDVRVMAATNRAVEDAVAEGSFREDLFYRLNVIRLDVPALAERVEDIPELAGRLIREHCEHLSLGAFEGMAQEALAALQAYAWPGNVRELRNVLERSLVLHGGPRIEFADLPREVRELQSSATPAAAAAAPQPSARRPAAAAASAAPPQVPPQGSLQGSPQGPSNGSVAARAAAPAAVANAAAAAAAGRTLREVREAAVATAERAYLVHLLRQTHGRINRTAERAGIRPRSLYDKMKQYGLRKEDFRGEV